MKGYPILPEVNISAAYLWNKRHKVVRNKNLSMHYRLISESISNHDSSPESMSWYRVFLKVLFTQALICCLLSIIIVSIVEDSRCLSIPISRSRSHTSHLSQSNNVWWLKIVPRYHFGVRFLSNNTMTEQYQCCLVVCIGEGNWKRRGFIS